MRALEAQVSCSSLVGSSLVDVSPWKRLLEACQSRPANLVSNVSDVSDVSDDL